jgi:hypothetical protein
VSVSSAKGRAGMSSQLPSWGRAPRWARFARPQLCGLAAGWALALPGCTLADDSFEPRPIEPEQARSAPLSTASSNTTDHSPQGEPSNTTSTEREPSSVAFNPGETSQAQLDAKEPVGSAASVEGETDPSEPPAGLAEPDAGGPPVQLEPCPGPTFEASCYEFFGAPTSWTVAEQTCVAWGGHLVSAASAAEDVFLERWPLELGIPVGNGSGLWLGGTDQEQDGVFRWSDGSPSIFVNWAANQPDNGPGDADCIEKRNDGTARWYDRRCTDPQPYACEKPR